LPLLAPRFDLAHAPASIDEDAVAASFDNVTWPPSIRDDLPGPRTPPTGHFVLQLRTGGNVVPRPYRLELQPEPFGSLAFSRLRSDPSLGFGGDHTRVYGEGGRIVVEMPGGDAAAAAGHLQMRFVCRQAGTAGSDDDEPDAPPRRLRVRLRVGKEQRDAGLDACWDLDGRRLSACREPARSPEP
jgi:hypothetical protein